MITGLGLSVITGFDFLADGGGGPVILPDNVKPTVTAFTLLAASSSLTVPITLLAAADFDAYNAPGTIIGWWLSESLAKPTAGAAGWLSGKPTSYTFTSAGSKTLWCFVKDASGNVSDGRSSSTVITLPDTGSIDTTATTRVYTLQSDGQIFTLAKQPNEIIVGIGIDFRRFLAQGETLTLGTCSGGIFMRTSGSVAYCAIVGGVSGETLRVTLTGYGSKGSLVEGELKVVVKEI